MCKKCSSYIDLHDYLISNAVSKNFKTKGSFVIEPTGYVFNSETLAREAVIKGRFIGKLAIERSLTIYETAQIKGSFTAAQLIIPASNRFQWKGEIKVGSAAIEGELTADLNAYEIIVRSTGRFTGSAKATIFSAEQGAVVVAAASVTPPLD
ncbi:MAG: polymer-forming cytoskeletal protein [Verrucomicrobiota bacterium]